MDNRSRAYAAVGAIVGIFLLVQLGALALVTPFKEAGYQAVEDPQDPANSIAYVFFILVMTGVMLAIIRYDVQWLLRVLLVWTGAYICLYVLTVLVPAAVVVPVDGFEVNAVAWAGAIALGVALWTYPEWYVIDIAGVVMGAGAAALFGISFGVLPALILLTVLAVYDAISVYGTEHMLTLASGVMELKVPIVLVIPLSLSYSYLDAEMPDPRGGEASEAGEGGADEAGEGETGASETGEGGADESGEGETGASETGESGEGETGASEATDGTTVEGETADRSAAANGGPGSPAAAGDESGEDEGDEMTLDREALFIGLGDAVIPTVLVASASFFAPESVPTVDLPGVTASVPALTALVGTIVGLVILLRMVLKGRAHAGLPLLNGGAIAGYLIGALASGLSLVTALGLDPYL